MIQMGCILLVTEIEVRARPPHQRAFGSSSQTTATRNMTWRNW